MSRNIALSDDLYHKAAELAARDRVSVEEFVSAVLAAALQAGSLSSREPGFSKEKSLSKP